MNRHAAALLAFVLVAMIALAVGWRQEYRRSAPVRGTSGSNIGQLARLELDGRTYVERPGMTNVLLLGVDNGGEDGHGARSGGQADFLMLLAIDHGAESVRRLQIDRDAIVEVDTCGVLGNSTGAKPLQICLAQVFGASREQNCANTRRAVERMLGIGVDCCVALDMDAIAAMNDALGGIVVTLADDFSAIDPQMAKGATLRLSGAKAERFVRSRMEIGDGTNRARMLRQQVFMAAAEETLRQRMRDDPQFIDRLFDVLEGDMTADTSRGRLLNEANRAWNYRAEPIETLPGQYAMGADGFVEFYPSPGAAEAWTVSAFYQMEE